MHQKANRDVGAVPLDGALGGAAATRGRAVLPNGPGHEEPERGHREKTMPRQR